MLHQSMPSQTHDIRTNIWYSIYMQGFKLLGLQTNCHRDFWFMEGAQFLESTVTSTDFTFMENTNKKTAYGHILLTKGHQLVLIRYNA